MGNFTVLFYLRHIDPDFFNCYTFNTNQMAAANTDLDIISYTSSFGRKYNYSDVIELYTSGAFVEVSITLQKVDASAVSKKAQSSTIGQVHVQVIFSFFGNSQ